VKIKHNKSVKYTHTMDTEAWRRKQAAERQAREEAEQREYERQERERKKQEEIAMFKGSQMAIGIGGYLSLKNINPAYDNSAFLISINPEFLSVADGHLSFGADLDFGFIELEKDTIGLCRVGTSAKLSFGEYRWLYLTTGAGLYFDNSHHDPLFSVGGGVRFGVFLDVQYYIVSMNNRNVGYWAIKGGASLPYSMMDMKEKSEKSGNEKKARRK